MLAAADLDVLWVVGANPLKNARLAASAAFVVVQDMFLTETAQRADVVLPAASAYEKNGTVTNVCGEVQRLKRAVKAMGAKPDLEIIGLLAREMGVNLGMWSAGQGVRRDSQERAWLRYSVAGARNRRRSANHAGERPRAGEFPAGADSFRARHLVHVGNLGALF